MSIDQQSPCAADPRRMQIEVEVTGKSCHGSMPWEGRNPLEYGAAIIVEASQSLHFLNDEFLGSGTRTASWASLATPSDCAVPERFTFRFDRRLTVGDVPACLSAHASNVDACAIPGSTAFAADFSAIEHVAAAASGAALIDLTDRICADDPCPVVVDRTIVFRDGEHMTATFSSSLAPALDAEISRVVNAPAGRDGI